jgi:hypothetical protein
MKKILSVILLSIVLLSGCSCKKDDSGLQTIPSKKFAEDNSTITTPINAANLDKYLFREDVQYIDLRYIDDILRDGYIAGFQFLPFHSIIASFGNPATLYNMKDVKDENGNWIYAGHVGGFYPQYQESEQIIKHLFDKNKKIFFVSQAGSEGSYIINLLIQLGYDGNKLYNVCGVMGTEGAYSYKSQGNPHYFV